MKNAFLTLILTLASLASAQEVRAGPAQPSSSAPREISSIEAGGDGDRGYRQAEQVLAAVMDISSIGSRYLGRVAEGARSMWEESRSVTCEQSNPCTYLRYFDISVGPKTKLALLFNVRLSEGTETICGDLRRDKSCDISASVFIAGDEAFPHCVGVEPILQAASRHGWSLYPFRYPPYDVDVSRYRHEDDKDIYLFIRTINGSKCFRSIYVVRLPTTVIPSQ